MRLIIALLAGSLSLLMTQAGESQHLLPPPKRPIPTPFVLKVSDLDAANDSSTRIDVTDQTKAKTTVQDTVRNAAGDTVRKAAGDTVRKAAGDTVKDKKAGDSDSPESKEKETDNASASNGQSDDEEKKSAKDEEPKKKKSTPRRTSRQRRPRFNPQVVARGQTAFQDACTQCHDEERSTSKRKSKAGWLATVKRMARMDGAEVETADFVPIATYLASLSAPPEASQPSNGSSDSGSVEDGDESSDEEGSDEASDDEMADDDDAGDELAAEDDLSLDDPGASFGSGLNISSTISTLYRGGNDNLENPGVFVDAWIRADWQPSGPIRGRITTCTSCHSDQTGDGGFTLELVEATAHFDLLHWVKERCPPECQPKGQAEIKAGRFVVPFGAFASMSHPGIYRTVTNPLMYNMGRQVNPNRTFAPVLPAPYSDEGVDLFSKIPVGDDWNLTVDAYAVNGLQGSGSGMQFTPSRSYADNNNELTVGGRATIGNGDLRFGGSIMSGRMNDDGATALKYKFAGADMTAQLLDNQVRLYFEYAIRDNETTFPENQIAYGTVSEIELLLFDDPNLSLLGRYDTIEHRNFFGDTSIERFTWGLSTTSFGGGLFMINHEHWNFPTGEKDVDVFGFRWVATF